MTLYIVKAVKNNSVVKSEKKYFFCTKKVTTAVNKFCQLAYSRKSISWTQSVTAAN